MNTTVLILTTCFCLTSAIKYRLPTTVKPSFYAIKLQPDLDNEEFTGRVLIHVKVSNLVKSILLHSTELNITSLYLNAEDLTVENKTFAYRFCEYQMLEIYRTEPELISPGDYTIHITYKGHFSKKEYGLYKAKATHDNHTSYLAVSDFEPTHARRVFPCFDEPTFKAKFQLTLVTPNSSYIAISNMPAAKRFETSYGVVYKFETSKIMSSYLVAFAITQYNYGERRGYGGVPIRAYTYKASDDNSKQILEIADKALEFYSDYTGYGNPLPKLDMIEYDRFQSVATENWGLITLNTGVLSNSTMYDEGVKANVITHEIAHFWFGNLVTNKWWDDIWLQEGFAVFMALKAEEFIFKNNATKTFPIDYLEDAIYRFDQVEASKPTINFAETPTAIRANFNDMSYIKGAAVLTMLELVLGEDIFQNAIKRYICQYAFKSASTDDLLAVFEDFTPSNVDLRGFVDSYLYQNRYPLIQVEEDEDSYVLTQRSCGFKNKDKASGFGYKWTIPVTYLTSLTYHQNQQPVVWFDRDMETLRISKRNETWIKFNHQQKGLYRMNYSMEFWDRFAQFGHEMDINDRNHVFLEAIQLYTADIISCDVALRYVLELINHNVTQPVKNDGFFIAHARLLKIAKYDKDASKMVQNFLQGLRKGSRKSSSKQKARPIRDVNVAQPTSKRPPTPPTENMKRCIEWIKANLQEYAQ